MNGAKRWPLGFGILYLMIHVPFVWWVKIGITGRSASKRAKQIDEAVFGFPVPVMIMILPGVYEIEQSLHRALSPLNARFYKGTGHTEWFWIPAAIPVFLMGCLYWWGLYNLLITFAVP